ncbi:MAG: alpha-amylase family glycosyl hydrolase [Microthrixaceae bacterium]
MTDIQSAEDHQKWWKSAVVYQIYPRSFADSSGDGVGDLKGITSRLDYLVDLGVDAIWLSPFFLSPMADFGYDISDHCAVDPLFGTMADFDELLAEAHARELKVILDFVPNHISDQHEWFQAALSSVDDPQRDWFHWAPPAADGGPPNNWTEAFGPDSAWTLDESSGEYYLHLFLPEQPDVDWNNPAVVQAMHQVLRFWMDKGVDGFRADVVHCIGKDPELPDMPEELVGLPAMLQDFGPGTHEQMRGLRKLVDSYPGDRMIVGETAFFDTERMTSYVGPDKLNLAFNFTATHCPWDAASWRAEAQLTYDLLERSDSWASWVLSSHDTPRQATRIGRQEAARAAAVLLLTLRGTPFLYMGEELGLENGEIPDESVVDPGGRDGCRTPMPWTSEPDHGWPGGSWLPFSADSTIRSAEQEAGDPSSMLELYRSLLRLRKKTPALLHGEIEFLDAPEGVLRWRRTITGPVGNSAEGGSTGATVGTKGSASGDTSDDGRGSAPTVLEIAINFTPERVEAAISDGEVLITSSGGSDRPGIDGQTADPGSGLVALGPDEARIVSPR